MESTLVLTLRLLDEVTAKLAAIDALADRTMRDRNMNLTSTGGGAGAGAAAAGAAAGGGSSGGGGGGSSLLGGLLGASSGNKGGLGGLLWQGGSGKSGFAGMASMFSIASLAGFGFEHVLTTVIGLAGSLTEALGGGMLLALGKVGTAMVGMGSDMAVMMTARQNVTVLATAQTKMNDAIDQYGASSPQAVAATKAYKFAISELPPVLQKSTVATATMWNATKDQWQTGTAQAQVGAQGIMRQVLSVAQDYIPLIGKAASRNFGIISASIKPLMAWLAGPEGMGIFQKLEDHFAKNLPTSIHAFTQGIELILKSMGFLSDYTGGLTKTIDNMLTKANSAEGFPKWEGTMGRMIGVWEKWKSLFKDVGKLLIDTFKQSVGLGTTIVTTLDSMVVQLDHWVTSTSGKASMHSLFAVHLQEIVSLLHLLPTLLGAFGSLYLGVAPLLTGLVAAIATLVGWMLKVPVAGTIMAWAVAITIMAKQMGILSPLLGGLGKLASLTGVSGILNKIPGVNIGGSSVSPKGTPIDPMWVKTEGGFGAPGHAPNTPSIGPSGEPLPPILPAAEGAGGAAVVSGGESAGLLATALPFAAATAIGAAIGLAVVAVLPKAVDTSTQNIPAKGGPGGHPAQVETTTTKWGSMFSPTDIKNGWDKVSTNIKGFFTGLLPNLSNLKNNVIGAVSGFFGNVGGFFKGLPNNLSNLKNNVLGGIGGIFGHIGHWFSTLDPGAWGKTLHNLIGDAFGKIGGYFKGLPVQLNDGFQTLKTDAKNFLGDHVGKFFRDLPGNIADGFTTVKTNVKNFLGDHVGKFFTDLPANIKNSLTDAKNAVANLFNGKGGLGDIFGTKGFLGDIARGAPIVTGAIGTMFSAISTTINGAVSGATKFVQNLLGITPQSLSSTLGASNMAALNAAWAKIHPGQKSPFQLAKGGIVSPTPGGTQVTVGEGGQSEAVIPLPNNGNFGGGATINIDMRGAFVGTRADADRLVALIGTRLATGLLPGAGVKLGRN